MREYIYKFVFEWMYKCVCVCSSLYVCECMYKFVCVAAGSTSVCMCVFDKRGGWTCVCCILFPLLC